MKKQIFAVIFALFISVVINASQTHAQSTEVIRVEVPFDFTANNKSLPAGTYIINSATDNRVMWKIQSAYQKPVAYLIAKSLSGAEEFGKVRLTFRRYGNRHFLIGFKTASYQVELPTSGSEKDFRRTWDDLAKSDVVTVGTSSER